MGVNPFLSLVFLLFVSFVFLSFVTVYIQDCIMNLHLSDLYCFPSLTVSSIFVS